MTRKVPGSLRNLGKVLEDLRSLRKLPRHLRNPMKVLGDLEDPNDDQEGPRGLGAPQW